MSMTCDPRVRYFESMSFQRARTDEQRAERRDLILATTRRMLNETPAGDLSLNELSRQVGLAKSNVLRYFETREAILLTVLEEELELWADDVVNRLAPESTDAHVAAVLAETMTMRPVMCDLMSIHSAVLERNVSTAVALAHKRGIVAPIWKIAMAVTGVLPALTEVAGVKLVTVAFLNAGALWPNSRPNAALRDAYASDEFIARFQPDFEVELRATLGFVIAGMLARA